MLFPPKVNVQCFNLKQQYRTVHHQLPPQQDSSKPSVPLHFQQIYSPVCSKFTFLKSVKLIIFGSNFYQQNYCLEISKIIVLQYAKLVVWQQFLIENKNHRFSANAARCSCLLYNWSAIIGSRVLKSPIRLQFNCFGQQMQ